VLASDSVGLVYTAGVPGKELTGLPELAVAGLPEDEARALLDLQSSRQATVSSSRGSFDVTLATRRCHAATGRAMIGVEER
jgi:hypothetical protein